MKKIEFWWNDKGGNEQTIAYENMTCTAAGEDFHKTHDTEDFKPVIFRIRVDNMPDEKVEGG